MKYYSAGAMFKTAALILLTVSTSAHTALASGEAAVSESAPGKRTAAEIAEFLVQNPDPPVFTLPGESNKPNSAELTRITQRGKDLFEYDRACAQATDALLAKFEKTSGFKHYVAVSEGAGGARRWVVAFGTISEEKDSFVIAYEVTIKAGEQPDVKAFEVYKVDRGELFKRARALALCAPRMKRTGPLMNYAALPASNDGYYVYQFPGSDKVNTYLLGGDVRFLTDSAGEKILETRQLHNSVLTWPRVDDLPPGAQSQGGCHTAILSDLPEDTDIFHVLLRKPALPEYIATANWIFCVETDGSIRLVSGMKGK